MFFLNEKDRLLPRQARDRYRESLNVTRFVYSTFIDNVLGGLLGLRGQTNASLVVSPLVDEHKMSAFAVDNLRYHGHEVSVAFDREGAGRYKPRRGGGAACVGLCVYVDGELAAHSAALAPLLVALNK